MKNIACTDCGSLFPMGKTFAVKEKTLCLDCLKKAGDKEEIDEWKSLECQLDPTVCLNCGKDNGAEVLGTIVGVPTCEECMIFFRNRPYPGWVKVGFAALILLVFCSLFWNKRFFEAYWEMKSGLKALEAGDVQEASSLISCSSRRIPESRELRGLADFFEGLVFLRQDKPREAYRRLTSCRGYVPEEFRVDVLILHAEAGKYFEDKDFDGFLRASVKLAERMPEDLMIQASVASAYACKYVSTGDPAFREKAIQVLEKTGRSAQGIAEFKAYEDFILHRIHSGEILTNEQFQKRYPNGWHGLGEQQ